MPPMSRGSVQRSVPDSPTPDTGPIEIVRVEPVFIDRPVERPVERIIEKPVLVPVPAPIARQPKKPALSRIEPPAVNSESVNNSAPPDEKNSESIRNNSEPANNSEKPAELNPFERVGKVGRKRKNEERKDRINSVRDVVLYRHIKGRHYPGLSPDMKRWYEFFYFKPPVGGEKPFNANTSYEQHCEAFKRGQEWIDAYEDHRTRPLGDS